MNEWEWQLLEDEAPAESLHIGGVEVKPGDRVRLRPRQGGDIFDMALSGMVATIEAIEQDYEGQFQLAVVVDSDPDRDLGLKKQPGHRFFFAPEEVAPLPADVVQRKSYSDCGNREYLPRRRCLRRGSGEAPCGPIFSRGRPRSGLWHPRVRPGLRVAGRSRRHHSRGRVPARRRTRNGLRHRGGLGGTGFSRRAKSLE